MVTRRQEVDAFVTHLVYQAMLLVDATGPLPAEFPSKRFGFARPGERVSEHILHESEGP